MKPMHTISLLGTQFGLLVLGLLLALCTTSQAGTILAEFRSNPPAGLPFELHGDVVGHAGVANPALLQVVEVDQAGNVIGTCTAQFNTWLGSGDSDFAGSAFFVPPEIRPPPRRFLIRSTGSAIPSDGEPLASTEGADVLVDNGHFTLRHPAAQGGLPERIDFASGAALTLEWEDRLYRADQGWFWPRADSQAEVTILANGELAAVVEVRARYLERNSGNAHPADPRLAYRFTYYADSPLVRLESSTSQASDFPWPELHVAHLSRPGVSSSASWAAANVTTTGYGQEATGGLPDLSRTLMATRWAAIWGASTATPPASVGLAVMLEGESEHSEHQVRLYSSADDSYNYLAGQWLRLDSLSAETLVWLGFYDLPELLPTIRSHWEQLSLVSPGRVLASGALSEVQAEREALPSFAPEQAVGRMLRHQLEELGRSAEQLDPYSEWQTRMEAWRQVNEQLTSSSARQASVELPWAGEGPTADTVYFVDRDYLLGFDGLNTLALAAIFHDASRTHFMAPGARASLFSAIFVEASEETASEATYRLDALRAQGADWTFDTEDRSLQLTYRRELEVPTDEVGASVTETVRAALTIQGDGASASLSGMVERTAGSRLRVDRLVLPLLGGLGGPGAAEQDEVVVPYSFGQRIAEPGRRCGYRQRYPVVRANMQLMSYRRGENNGLMAVFTQDPLGRIKELECLRDRPRTHEFHLSWTHYPDEGPGQVASFTLDFPARIVLTEGDWYDAARIYRTWATEQMWTGHGSLRGRPDRPEWLADVSMWFRAHGDGPELAATLDEMRQTVFESTDDPPAIAVRYYDWHQIPFDNNYPEYFPAKEGVAQAIDQLWQEGIAVMPYINGQLWDRDTKSWLDLNALDFATRDRWGALVTETWAGQEHSVMCPYTSLWHTVQVDLATCILGDASCTYLGAVYSGLHAPALYIDQVGETRPVMCHAAHGSDPASQHPPGGVLTWVAGRRALMADIRSLEGSLDREIFLSTEGGAEPYLDLFDGFLMLSSRDVIDKVPLLTAVYNEYIVNFTVGISAAELAGTNSAARSKLAESFLFGSQGSVYEWWIDCGAEPLQFEFITRLGLAWRAGSEYLAYGEMLRPPRLSGDYDLLEEIWQTTNTQYRQVLSPSVRAAAYRADDGSIGLFVTNASLSEQPVTIEWEYGRRVIEERLLDGSTVAHGTGDSLDLVMEPIDVRMFVLTEELTLEEELELDEVVLDRPLEPTDAGPGEPDLSDDLDLAGDLPEEPDVGEEVETDDPVDPDALADREEATDMQADPDAPLSPAEAPEGCRCSAVPNSYNWHLAAILLAIWLVRRRVRLDAGSRDNV